MTKAENSYAMSDKKTKKLSKVKAFFDSLGLFYDEKGSGQLVFDSRFNLWATTEKWHDTANNQTGVGINGFCNHLKENGLIK